MFIKISKKELLKSLNIVSRAISNYSPLPAFSGIKFDVSEQEICLMASDSDLSIKTYLLASEDFYMEILQTGSIVIESRYILDIVRKMNEDIVEIEVSDGCNIKISDSKSTFNIIGIYANEYPLLDFETCNDSFSINSNIFKQMINQIIFATSDKDTRPYLNGINFHFKEHCIECTATDSYRLAKTSIAMNKTFDYNIIVPTKSLNEVYKSLEDEEELSIFVSDKKIQFMINKTVVQTRLIEGKFPDTNALVPTEFLYELKLNTRDIVGAIDRLSFIKNDNVNIIKMDLNETNCMISSKSQEIGFAEEILSSSNFKGNPLIISCNGRFVFDAIKSLQSEHVFIKFSGEMKPFIIGNEEEEHLIQLILPVRTYL